jgi:hypothetical protein
MSEKTEKTEKTDNENTPDNDVEIEPLSDNDMDTVAGGTYREPNSICSVTLCS